MSLTDISFIFIFLPLTMLVCCFRGNVKTLLLVMASLIFYSCGTPEYILHIAMLMFIDIAVANIIEVLVSKSENRTWAARSALIAGIALNAGFLLFFKFTSGEHVLPLGISVFTFKVISLFADIYRKKVVVSQNPLKIILYLLFFGQIISGPMTRYDDFFREDSLAEPELFWKNTIHNIETGSFYFVRGFAKKTVFANIMKIMADEAFAGQVQNSAVSFFWLGAAAFTLQIYYDFSGYSDMAKGISNALGYGCADNFDHPYCSGSISEFWRRWHMSLGSWLRDYVYIPLGGSRKGMIRTVLNLVIVWLLTAVWHGSGITFILWGMMNCLAVMIEKVVIKPAADRFAKTDEGSFLHALSALIRHTLVILFLNIQWVMFNSKDLPSFISYIRNMFSFRGELIDARTIILCRTYGIYILLGIIFTLPVADYVSDLVSRKSKALENVYGVICGVILAALFMVGLSLVVSGQNDPFLYGGF